MWGLIISTIIYALVVWKIGPILDEHGLKKSMQKNIVLALIAFTVSIMPLMLLDYLEKPIESDKQTSLGLNELNGLSSIEALHQGNNQKLDVNSNKTPVNSKPLTIQEKDLKNAIDSLNEYSKLSK